MRRKGIIWIIGLILVVTLVYLGGSAEDSTYYFTGAWLMSVFVLLWAGNSVIGKGFDKGMPWITYGKKRFFIQLLSGILYSLLIINVAYFAFKLLLTEDPPVTSQIIVMNVWGIVLTIPAYSISFGLHFLNQWQNSRIEVERYQKETTISQLTSLKNHLDPHFLFNNLNILSSLIDKDRELSQEFLVRFAEVYRTLLLNKGEDLVTLEEELAFIQSYIFLIETRFEKNILFDINISPEAYCLMVPPLTVQMVIENAIKHNSITQSRPLQIQITSNGSRLHIANSLFEKPEELKSKSGTGLKNIKARFKYFSEEELVIQKSEDEFRVSIPMLEVETL